MRTQQDRTFRKYNMHVCDAFDCDDDGWPIIHATDTVPNGLTTFEVATSDKHPDEFAHFFIDDYRFERLWNDPEKYVPVLKRYSGVLSPDFSLYTDMPLPMQVWNSYRSKALASYWQRCGIDVIPTLCWSDERSHDFAFSGIPERSTVAVSTVGVARNKEACRLFEQGLREAIARLMPQCIVWYGKMLELDMLGTKVVNYPNDNHERVQKWEAEERQAVELHRAEGHQK